MNLLEAQFPFWLGAVLCVKWGLGQRTSAGRGKEVVNVGVNPVVMLETGLRLHGGFAWSSVEVMVCVTWICRRLTFGELW